MFKVSLLIEQLSGSCEASMSMWRKLLSLEYHCWQHSNYSSITSFTWPMTASPHKFLGIPRKPYFYLFLMIFYNMFGIFGQILKFLINITWFLSFSSKNDAASLCHFVKIQFLDLKRAKLDQNSDFCHVRTYQDLFY